MTHRFTLYFIVPFIILSCNNYPDGQISAFDVSDMTSINGEEVCIDTDIMSPRSLYLFKDRLFLIDKYEDMNVTMISLDDYSSSRVLPSGNGPHEFLRIASFHSTIDNTSLGVYDNRKQKYVTYKTEEEYKFSDETLIDEIKVTPIDGTYTLIPYKDGYIANGAFDNNMFTYMNMDFSVINSFGQYPGDNASQGTHEFFQKNQTVIHVNHNSCTFVAAGVYNDWLTFYKEVDNRFVLSKEYFTYDSDVTTSSTSIQGITQISNKENENTVRGYRALCSSSNYIYALYWGIKSVDIGSPNNKCYILKFTNNGDYINGYIVEDLLRYIAVDEEDEYLYAITFSQTENEVLMKYKL